MIHENADSIVASIASHKKALSLLEEKLPIVCATEGHRWSEPERINEDTYDQEVGKDSGTMSGFNVRTVLSGHEYWWVRGCARCGKVDQQKEIVREIRQSPFGDK